jgi:hypothetical protein
VPDPPAKIIPFISTLIYIESKPPQKFVRVRILCQSNKKRLEYKNEVVNRMPEAGGKR